jgi:hypothetical protein
MKAGKPLRGLCCYRDPLGMRCTAPAEFEIHPPGFRSKPRTEACAAHVQLLKEPGELIVPIEEDKEAER